jgi:hypothetical protein
MVGNAGRAMRPRDAAARCGRAMRQAAPVSQGLPDIWLSPIGIGIHPDDGRWHASEVSSSAPIQLTRSR